MDINKNFQKKRRGQGATEYIIILVLVAIASIAVITTFGDQLRELFNVSTARIRGDTSTTANNFDASDKVEAGLDNF